MLSQLLLPSWQCDRQTDGQKQRRTGLSYRLALLSRAVRRAVKKITGGLTRSLFATSRRIVLLGCLKNSRLPAVLQTRDGSDNSEIPAN